MLFPLCEILPSADSHEEAQTTRCQLLSYRGLSAVRPNQSMDKQETRHLSDATSRGIGTLVCLTALTVLHSKPTSHTLISTWLSELGGWGGEAEGVSLFHNLFQNATRPGRFQIENFTYEDYFHLRIIHSISFLSGLPVVNHQKLDSGNQLHSK